MWSPSDDTTDISKPSIDALDVHFDNSQAFDQSPDVVEDDNNDNDGVVPLSPVIPPQFNSMDPYAVLGVPTNATERQIKSLYCNLAKMRYPNHLNVELNKDNGHMIFAAIGNAYKILGNPERRAEHDALQRIAVASDSDEESNYDEDSDDDRDRDDDNDSNDDGDSPPDIVSTSYTCDWTFVVNGCSWLG
jgi:hypothetical protein